MNRSARGLPGRAKKVKRFKRSYGLDTELYKNYLFIWKSCMMLNARFD